MPNQFTKSFFFINLFTQSSQESHQSTAAAETTSDGGDDDCDEWWQSHITKDDARRGIGFFYYFLIFFIIINCLLSLISARISISSFSFSLKNVIDVVVAQVQNHCSKQWMNTRKRAKKEKKSNRHLGLSSRFLLYDSKTVAHIRTMKWFSGYDCDYMKNPHESQIHFNSLNLLSSPIAVCQVVPLCLCKSIFCFHELNCVNEFGATQETTRIPFG